MDAPSQAAARFGAEKENVEESESSSESDCREVHNESDSSSTTSEETQIWVPANGIKPNVPKKTSSWRKVEAPQKDSRQDAGDTDMRITEQPKSPTKSWNSGDQSKPPIPPKAVRSLPVVSKQPAMPSTPTMQFNSLVPQSVSQQSLSSPVTHSRLVSIIYHQPTTMANAQTTSPSISRIVFHPSVTSPTSSDGQGRGMQLSLADDSLTGNQTNYSNTSQRTLPLRLVLVQYLSALYAACTIITGVLLQLALVFAGLSAHTFECFYIYMLAGSLIFLIYVYSCLIRTSAQSSSSSVNETPNRPLITKSHDLRYKMIDRGHTGCIILRLGVIGFGIGAMLLEGMCLGQLVEVGLRSDCVAVTQLIRPTLQLVFIFTQMYFIFLNAKMSLNSSWCLTCFGLMHLTACNLCLWTRSVTMESLRMLAKQLAHLLLKARSNAIEAVAAGNHIPPAIDLQEYLQGNYTAEYTVVARMASNHTADVASVNSSSSQVLECNMKIMGGVVQSASPFLYPCSVAYSFICTENYTKT